MAEIDAALGGLAGNILAGTSLLSAGAGAKKAREKGRIAGSPKLSFRDVLRETGETEAPLALPPSEEALQQLLDSVHSSGDDLKKRQTHDNIRRYRQAVRDFLHYVVENGFAVETKTGRLWRGSRKQYTLVQVADRRLEELATVILSGQAAQLDILARIDEINGILVNILQ